MEGEVQESIRSPSTISPYSKTSWTCAAAENCTGIYLEIHPILGSFIKNVILGKRVRGRQAREADRVEATVDSATSSHSRGRRSYFRRT